ncbi:MAG TPA: radical SAM protein [Bacteroidales bacterium]|nr:radical SAM protein [Bacteroidales bacterium]HPS17625.1 radical SAM protein [Bacteroidales bacterium]
MRQGHYIIPVFIPDLACPHQCIFCNQKKISGHIAIPSIEDVKQIIEKHLSTIPKGSKIEIGFFGGNFTGVDINLQKEFLTVAKNFIDNGKVLSIRLSTRPDYINENILKFLKSFSVSTIELGAQSFDDEVLRLSGRGHDSETTIKSSVLIKQYGFDLGLQMMIGLPGDTKENSIITAHKIVELGAENTRIYPALVIKDTALEKLFHENKYKPLSIEESVDWVKDIYKIFEDAGITILRVGLHPSEGLINKEVLIAGPFHVSFRELVLAEIWKEIFQPLLKQNKKENILITVPSEEFNYAIGYEASNKKMLQQHFKNVKFVANASLKGRNFNVDYC